jgi:hypothetical protein
MTHAGKGQGDYKIGYGKPPEHTRFRPGQSGNPAGRPRAAAHPNRQCAVTVGPAIYVTLCSLSKVHQ